MASPEVLTTAMQQGGFNAVLFIGGVFFLIYFMRIYTTQTRTVHEFMEKSEARNAKMIADMLESQKQSSERWRETIEKHTSAHFALHESISSLIGVRSEDRRQR